MHEKYPNFQKFCRITHLEFMHGHILNVLAASLYSWLLVNGNFGFVALDLSDSSCGLFHSQ